MNKTEQKKIDVAFLENKLVNGFSVWAKREIEIRSQHTNIHRLSDSVFAFIEYNFLPSCKQDILDGHYTFFVNKDTFEYLVYKSSDYGSFTYVIPVDFDGFLTAELLPKPSRERVESIIADKLLTSYFYDSDHINHKGALLFPNPEDNENIYAHRSLIVDNRGYIWTKLKPEIYSEIEVKALNKLCGFIQPDIKDFDKDFIKSFLKGFKPANEHGLLKYNNIELNGKQYTLFYYKELNDYYHYSLVESTNNVETSKIMLENKICELFDNVKPSEFISIIPTILRNICNN